MQSVSVAYFFWPDFGNTVSIAALVLALAIFVFGMFSGVRANKIRIIFAIILSTVIGWLTMPLAVKAVSMMGLANSKTGVVVLVTVMMLMVAAVGTSIYEIITVTLPDISSKK
jgi:hypothetical protein